MKPIISQFHNYLLNYRHLVAIGFTLFFIIIGVTTYLVYNHYKAALIQINRDFNKQQLVLAQQAAIQINSQLFDIKLSLDNLKKLLTGKSKIEPSEVISAVFEQLNVKGLMEIGLIGPEGKIIFHVGYPKQVDTEKINRKCKLNHSDELKLGNIQVEKISPKLSSATYMFCMPVFFEESGTMLLFAKLNTSELVKNVTSHIQSGKTGYAWIINQQGIFIYHPEDEFIGKNAFSARKERVSYISYSQINMIMKDQMLSGAEGMASYVSGWHRGMEGQMTKLIAFTPVKNQIFSPDQIWSVAVVAPISEVADITNQIYKQHFIMEVAIVAVVCLFGFLVTLYQQKISWALQQRVDHQEKHLSNILDYSVDGVLFIDNDNKIQIWNKGAEAIFGYSAQEMIGNTFHRLIPPELDADFELEQICEEVRTKGFIKNEPAQRVTKSGDRITTDISRTQVNSKNMEPIGSTVIIRDVTEKVKMDQNIYNTEKLASIGILAAGVAHEINNPLAIILGFTDLLLEKFEPDSAEYEDLKMIEENGNHAKAIVENMLGFARITEGLEETVDINQSVDIVIKIVKNTLLTKKIELYTLIPKNLPRVRGDTREFQQVVFNLINNSIAAMKKTGGMLILSATEKAASVSLNVTDNGPGIPDAIKKKIFDPFFTTKKAGEGTGLGLSLCYGIVKKYKGNLEFKSSSAEDDNGPTGTTFSISMLIKESDSK
jgi:two-component system, NtrC family, sensor kinase